MRCYLNILSLQLVNFQKSFAYFLRFFRISFLYLSNRSISFLYRTTAWHWRRYENPPGDDPEGNGFGARETKKALIAEPFFRFVVFRGEPCGLSPRGDNPRGLRGFMPSGLPQAPALYMPRRVLLDTASSLRPPCGLGWPWF